MKLFLKEHWYFFLSFALLGIFTVVWRFILPLISVVDESWEYWAGGGLFSFPTTMLVLLIVVVIRDRVIEKREKSYPKKRG